jgi:hypothetical protein
MCLACEMDALWFAEMEAAAPGSAGVPPALKDSSVSPAPGSFERAGVPPALPGGVPGGTPTVPASTFICEETRSA